MQPRANYAQNHAVLSMKEIKQLLQARSVYIPKGLLERSEFVALLLQSTPKNDWARKLSVIEWQPKWKNNYIVAQLDSTRCSITKDELCSYRWKLRFKNWPDRQSPVDCKFYEDYTFQSDLFDHSMKWRFYAGSVQVEQYPPNLVTRTKDWGWTFENEHVVFYQV